MTDTEQSISRDTKVAMLFQAGKKSLLIAYLLWFALGWFGAHRFYMSRIVTGIIMVVLFVVGLLLFLSVLAYEVTQSYVSTTTVWFLGIYFLSPWIIWCLIDAFRLPGMVRKWNYDLIEKLS